MEHYSTITFVGQMNVGKTALIRRFMYGETISNYEPTIEDIYNKTLEHENNTFHFRLIDTSGDSQFNVLKEVHYAESDYIVFVYSVNNKNSFIQGKRDLKQILSILLSSGRETMPSIILVGNKCDLKKQRKVSALEAQNLVSLISGICPCAFFETSALYNVQVNDLFNIFITGVPETKKNMLNQQLNNVNHNVSLIQLNTF
ncbi:Rap GTPase, putative [Entamoeba histolytica HM-1:IMSS-B]|uniref:Rap GTPase n=6 Tax=Entamoeba histolytica TaxID=5759 RepID=C4LWM8_ENTH1|nr:Rap GTPase [Entamoeba histolytica HM-1:IMSS]EMD43849.1 Rap GTPase, putative [Entamoeba histolytica KU27]EMH77067.1 Rap GTPase, putative [Entamoeba histolytica HM-1:IMSS-B]EMS16805.1 Rap GTPase [Entamoeba histolytica HM-3:IMSS]ENY65969.1 Rap GTPase, putative [Entamoeba histolytica HM-1:IMSS-A]GAT93117.1 rap GTPase [Entamoeba histolytica]|eukprot:XP_655289.1 Rap GTPase [Entamoeba histolytica HM-1:IMSS]